MSNVTHITTRAKMQTEPQLYEQWLRKKNEEIQKKRARRANLISMLVAEENEIKRLEIEISESQEHLDKLLAKSE